jgi:hypothetical protein
MDADGGGLQVLNTQGLPEPFITGSIQGWDGEDWVLLHLWDGRDAPNARYVYRFRADGSGQYERLGRVRTPTP